MIRQRAKNCECANEKEDCECVCDTALDFVMLGGSTSLFEVHAEEMGLMMPLTQRRVPDEPFSVAKRHLFLPFTVRAACGQKSVGTVATVFRSR